MPFYGSGRWNILMGGGVVYYLLVGLFYRHLLWFNFIFGLTKESEMERWEEEFDDMFPEMEDGDASDMAKHYFMCGWMQAIQLLQDKIDNGGFDYE